MPEQCVHDTELAFYASLSADDLQMSHFTDCPECRARLAACKQFLAGNEEFADLEREAAIGDILNQEIFHDSSGNEERTPSSGPSLIKRLSSLFILRGLRPAIAVVAVLFVGLLIQQNMNESLQPVGVFRNDSNPESTGALILQEPVAGPAGIILAWTPQPQANSYRILFFSTSLQEIGRQDVDSSCKWVLSNEFLDSRSLKNTLLIWRVQAIKNGTVLNTSASGSIPANPQDQ